MNAGAPRKIPNSLIDRLPRDRRDELIMIGRDALGRFGYAFQDVFDDHLAVFEYLAGRGATAVMIGEMLAEVGIARNDGTPLPAGTVSSAMSRARERAEIRSEAPLHAPARAGMFAHSSAEACDPLHDPADLGREAESAEHQQRSSTHAAPNSLQFADIRRPLNSPVTTQVPTLTRRSAALLEQLRSKQNDD
ncbi:hypothetical protein AB8B21_31510 [Tardiphaga sp. 866_E4_N2_1]|uniref:hypothetical protein n=1 Tax=unclassified Tardiphaga TaxID=2631404 RepID=UPI003F20DF10